MNPKPDILSIKTAAEFKKWYWLKAELITFAKRGNISTVGSKFEIRDRIIFAFENPGKPLPKTKRAKPISKFNWAKERLSLDTIITDSISFGPNFRIFMSAHIGPSFQCHADFMDWVKANPGKTLQEAVITWENMEQLKKKGIKRIIRPHNMYNQYLRDFFESTQGLKLKDAKKCWAAKKAQKSADGVVSFEKVDLQFLK